MNASEGAAAQQVSVSIRHNRVLWYCAVCRRVGSVESDASMSKLWKAIEEDHRRLAQTFPLCSAQLVDLVPRWMEEGIVREALKP